VTIPDTVVSIGQDAFNGTAWLNNQPSGIVYAGKVAYCYKGTCPASLSFDSGTKGIASGAFKNCTALKSVSIHGVIQVIGESAFAGSGLTSVTIPSSVHYINDSCFENCTGLTEMTFNGDIETFGRYAISGCSALSKINVYGQIKNIRTSVDKYDKQNTHKMPTQAVTLWYYNTKAPEKVEESWLKTGTVYLYSSAVKSAFETAFATNPGIAVKVHTNVLYKLDTGSVYTVQWYTKGDRVVYPADPVKSGYTFAGWNPNITIVYDDENVLTATFTMNSHTPYPGTDQEELIPAPEPMEQNPALAEDDRTP
jgi:hypothetical protein